MPAQPEYRPTRPAGLPRPTRDQQQLKSDLALYGYCLIERALDPETLAKSRSGCSARRPPSASSITGKTRPTPIR